MVLESLCFYSNYSWNPEPELGSCPDAADTNTTLGTVADLEGGFNETYWTWPIAGTVICLLVLIAQLGSMVLSSSSPRSPATGHGNIGKEVSSELLSPEEEPEKLEVFTTVDMHTGQTVAGEDEKGKGVSSELLSPEEESEKLEVFTTVDTHTGQTGEAAKRKGVSSEEGPPGDGEEPEKLEVTVDMHTGQTACPCPSVQESFDCNRNHLSGGLNSSENCISKHLSCHGQVDCVGTGRDAEEIEECCVKLFKAELIPVLSRLAMHDIIITTSGFKDAEKRELISLVEKMGGGYCSKYTVHVTHMVASSVLSPKVIMARSRELPVMRPEWIHEVWQKSQTDTVDATDAEFARFETPIFSKLCFCFSQLTQEQKDRLEGAILGNGGTHSPALVRKQVNILIVPSAEGPKFRHANAWSILCLRPDWILDSCEAGYALDPANYKVIDPAKFQVQNP